MTDCDGLGEGSFSVAWAWAARNELEIHFTGADLRISFLPVLGN